MQDPYLLSLLRDCYDPLTRRNVVELNLVRAAALTPDADSVGILTRYVATVSLAAPGSDEAANAQLAAQIENRLLGVEAISKARVALLPPVFSIL